VYVCNLMTQAGETNQFTASDHIKAIYHHVDQPFIQKIIVNSGDIPENVKLRYKGEYAEPVLLDKENLLELGLDIMSGEIATYEDSVIRHDTVKISEMLFELILNETKENR
jgi:uncharacterized cofD-like protein